MKKYILTLAILVLFNVMNVKAATFTSSFIGGYHYVDSEGRWGDFEMFYRTDNNKIVYCIEPGTSLTSEEYEEYKNLSFEELASKVGLTENQLNLISLYAYYGYGYQTHTSTTWIVATQAKIWEVLGRSFQFTSQNNPSNPWEYVINTPTEIKSAMNALDALVKKYLSLMEDLNNEHYDILIGGGVTIKNNNLNNFDLITSDEYVVLENGVLTISPTAAKDLTEITLKLKEDSSWAEEFIVYHSDNGQDLFQPGNLKQTISFTYSVLSGSVRVYKYDSTSKSCQTSGTASLENAVYGVYKSSGTLVGKITIQNCTATMSGLATGSYYIQELESPYGYALDTKKYYFSINRTNIEEEQILTVYDVQKEIEVKINKKYLEENDISLPESGATFDIVSNTTNEVVKTITTDINGNASTKLPYDTYTLIQKNGKENYIFSENQTFTIDDTTNEISINLVNEPYVAGVTLYKYNKNTQSCTSIGTASLENAVYGVYKKDGTLVEKVVIQNCTASASGLVLGDYYIKEIESPYGYELDETEYSFTLTKENTTKNLELTLYDIPKEIEIKINKKYLEDENITLPESGATFDIVSNTTNKVVKTITTDNDGNASVTLPYDSYTLIQKSGKENYIFSENQTFTIDDTTKEININLINEPYKKKIRLIKVEKDTDKRIFEANIEFRIYDVVRQKYVCEDETCTYKTNMFGEFITKELFPSTYIIEEVKKENKGYLWSIEKIVVELNQNSEDITIIRFSNEKVLGKIIVYKANEDKMTLEGVEFALYASETIYDVDKKVLYEKGELITTQKTDMYGQIIFENLPLGKYYIKEIKALSNYLLDDTCYEIELSYIDEDTKIVTTELSLINYQVPNTLKNASVTLPIINPIYITEGIIYNEKKNHSNKYSN